MILSKSTCLVLTLLLQMIIVHTHQNLVMKVHLSTHLFPFSCLYLGEGTAIHGRNDYVQLQRVWFSRS